MEISVKTTSQRAIRLKRKLCIPISFVDLPASLRGNTPFWFSYVTPLIYPADHYAPRIFQIQASAEKMECR